jgi:TP901 family phage tail tape measure protein
MAGSLGTIAGQVRLETAQAIAGFAAVRAASARTSGTMAAAGTRMSTFGKVSMGAGLALVAGFGLAIKAAADFEKKMDYFGAVNNATAADMEKVRAKALQLGRDSQFSAGQIADAFVEMGKAGVSVRDITGGLADAIVNMAAAADINLAQATNIVTATIQTYGLNVKDAAHVTDLFAGAANASIVDVEDLGVSLKYVGGVAHSLGISFDSTTTALSLLGKAGIKGSTAGTSLRQIMVSLAGGTNKAKGVLEDLGIITLGPGGVLNNAFFDASGKAKSLAEIFQILQDHTRNLTQEQQLMAFRTIFNNRALAASEILTHAGAKGFADMAAQMAKTTAADVAAKRMDNLSGDVKKLKSSIDTLMIQAGTPFQNMLRGIVQSITKVINAFINLPSGVQTAILAFIGILGVILTFLGAVALIGGTIFKAVAVFKQMAAALKILWVATKALTVATWEQTVAALSNPYVLIAIAVIALATAFYVLYTKSDKFRAIMDATGRGLKIAFLATVNWFKTLPAFFEGLWKDIAGWFSTGVTWVKKNWDILLALMTGPIGVIILIWHRFGDSITGFFKAIPGAVSKFTSDAISAVLSFIQKLPYYIGYGLGFTLGIILKTCFQMGQAIYNFGAKAVTDTVSFFQQLPGRLATFFTQMYQSLVNFSVQFGVGTKNWAVGTYNSVVTWFAKLPGRVYNFFVSMWHNAVGAWNSFNNSLNNFLVTMYNNVVNWFSKLPGRVYNFLVSMKNNAVTALSNLASSAGTWGSNIYNAIEGWFSKLPSAAWDAITNTINAFHDMISQAYDAAKGFGKGLWDGFRKGIGINSPSYIEKAMWQITKVTDQETTKLGNQVRTMQSLAGKIAQTNPARASASFNEATLQNMTQSMQQQMAAMHATAQAIYPLGTLTSPSGAAASSRGSSTLSPATSGSPLVQKVVEVNVHNPIAERASDSTSRKLRNLAAMGAF